MRPATGQRGNSMNNVSFIGRLASDPRLRELPTVPDFGRLTGGLGQLLFDPPNVAGWAGGRTWITPATLLQRGNLFRDVLFADAAAFRPPSTSLSRGDRSPGCWWSASPCSESPATSARC